jgi:hypothetical protein
VGTRVRIPLATISISLIFFVPCSENIGRFLEHESVHTSFRPPRVLSFATEMLCSSPVLVLKHPFRLLGVERHCTLELWRADARVDLRRVDPRMTEERANLLQVVMLAVAFIAATVLGLVEVTMTSTPARTSSDAKSPRRFISGPEYRCTNATLRPST